MCLRVTFNLCVSEMLFYLGHRLMHTHPTLVKYHVLHHCSTNASWNTNFLFHPIDLAVEFAGPVVVGVLGTHYYLWNQDQATLVITLLIVLIWYACDHDEHLNLYHIEHHSKCDSLYAIYCNIRGNPKHNILQQQMKQKLKMPKNAKK